MISCASDNCRTQVIRMAYLKGAFIGVLYNLFTCEHPKKKTRDAASGGATLSGEADLTNTIYSLYDNFDGTGDLAEHIPDVGNTWTLGTGSLTLSGGLLTLDSESDAQHRIIFSNTLGIADTTIDFYMLFAADFESGMNIDFNRTDNANRWTIYFSPPYVILSSYVGGVSTSYGTDTGTIGPTSMHLRIVTNDDIVEVYRDEVLVLSANVTDRPNKSSTDILINWFQSSGTVQFDKITALGVFNPP